MIFDHDEYEELIEMITELKKLISISKICLYSSLKENEIELIIGPSMYFIDWMQKKIDTYERKLAIQEICSKDINRNIE